MYLRSVRHGGHDFHRSRPSAWVNYEVVVERCALRSVVVTRFTTVDNVPIKCN